MTGNTAKILVVDDEENIRFFLEETLLKDGYQVTTAENGEAALRLSDLQEYDLALIDLRMPGMSGIDLMSALHQRSPDIVVIVLTAYASLDTAVEALRQGAHDYLFKPCKSAGIRESVHNGLLKHQQGTRQKALLSRLEQELRNDLEEIRAAVQSPPISTQQPQLKPEPEEGPCLRWKDLMIDLSRHTVTINRQNLDLSPTEYDLLVCLVSEAPKVVSSQRLVRKVQGYESQPWEAGRIVRYHIYRIRQKAKKITGRDDLVRTIRGVGYTLSE
ncbi:MAG TPA: response regulator transcription factor [Anaerolineaceae bacterium]|nr:response regulator transcription factor [Anaerolineaceae bacterium]